MDDGEHTYDLGAFAALIRRRLGLILGAGALLAAIVFGVSLTKPDRYEATSVLLFRDSGLDLQILGRPNPSGGDRVLDPDTNVGLASLDVIASRARRQLAQADPTAAGSIDRIEVREGAGPELVEITAASESPAAAAAAANAYAEAFIEFRVSSSREAFERTRAVVRAELQAGGEAPDSQTATRLRQQLTDLRSLELLQTGDVELVERADVPSSPTGLSPLRKGVLGGLAGLLVGLALALVVEGADPRLRTRRDYERAFAAPVVGSHSRSSLADPQPGDFNGTLTRLRFAGGVQRGGAWLVTSAQDGGADHASIALGLARAAAGGLRVALVEAEMAAPTLAHRLGVEPVPGLADLLGGAADGRSIRRLIEVEGGRHSLTLVPAGSTHANPARLLADPRIGELLTDLTAEHELVIIDGPRTGPGAEVIPMGVKVSGVVVGTTDRASAAEAELVREVREWLPASLLGVVRITDKAR